MLNILFLLHEVMQPLLNHPNLCVYYFKIWVLLFLEFSIKGLLYEEKILKI